MVRRKERTRARPRTRGMARYADNFYEAGDYAAFSGQIGVNVRVMSTLAGIVGHDVEEDSGRFLGGWRRLGRVEGGVDGEGRGAGIDEHPLDGGIACTVEEGVVGAEADGVEGMAAVGGGVLGEMDEIGDRLGGVVLKLALDASTC